MNQRQYFPSNATKARALAAATMISVGLQGALLWKMNEVAASSALDGQQAQAAPAAPVQDSIRQATLAPVTIIARRPVPAPGSPVLTADKGAAQIWPNCECSTDGPTPVENRMRNCC